MMDFFFLIWNIIFLPISLFAGRYFIIIKQYKWAAVSYFITGMSAEDIWHLLLKHFV